MVMDLEGEMTIVPMPTQSSNYLHESSTKLKLMASGNNGTQNQQQQQPPTTTEEPSRAPVPAAPVTAVSTAVAPAGGYDATASAVAAAAAAVAATMANNNNANSSTNTGNGNGSGSKKPVRYRECQKNHAAGIGGHALDGCGEFMPSGEEGTIEALKCSACDCHRNFHRREVEGETPPACESCWYKSGPTATPAAGIISASKDGVVKKRTPSLLSPLAAITPGSNIDAGVAGTTGGGYSSGMIHHPHMNSSGIKKRFRTKFTNEQKERMYQFADRLGWRIQKHDEAEVQQFCAEVGVKRHVLKVWMHNNKNTYGKKL